MRLPHCLLAIDLLVYDKAKKEFCDAAFDILSNVESYLSEYDDLPLIQQSRGNTGADKITALEFDKLTTDEGGYVDHTPYHAKNQQKLPTHN